MFRLVRCSVAYDPVEGEYTVDLLWIGVVDSAFVMLPQTQIVATAAGITTASNSFVSEAYTFYGVVEP